MPAHTAPGVARPGISTTGAASGVPTRSTDRLSWPCANPGSTAASAVDNAMIAPTIGLTCLNLNIAVSINHP